MTKMIGKTLQMKNTCKGEIVDYKLVKGQIDTPEDFNVEYVVGHELEHRLQLAFIYSLNKMR